MWIYAAFLPVIFFVSTLLIYVFLRPMLYKHKDDHVYVPHGIAGAIVELEAIKYKHIGVTIDFSKNDTEAIRHAIMQGGKHAAYTLIHVVETAGARYYGNEVMDMETQSDVDNINKYAESIRKMGYNAGTEIGYGAPSASISRA